ncbi:MAG: glycosyltransferase family 4 protein [Planctomycetota bacterium]
MHILIVHQYFLSRKDGGGSRWNQFAKYWAQAGHKITVLAGTVNYLTGRKLPKYKGKFVVRERQMENLDVLRCYVSEAYNKSFLGRFWAYVLFTLSSILAGLFCVGKCDVIICTSPPLTVGLTGLILSKLKRIPMVFEVRDLWLESFIDMGLVKNKWVIKITYWLQRKIYNSAEWINVLTPAFEEFLVSVNGIPREKISMIPNAADLDIIKPAPRDNQVREKHNLDNKFVVTYVGSHGITNALMQLIEAAKILKEKDPDVRIMLVGDGIRKPRLREKAAQWGLDNMLFVDSVPKNVIADYIAASDVCTAVLKRLELFKAVYPNKVFDYMSAARPVIIAIDGVARKLVEDAKAGIYVEPENAEEFVEAVLKLKENTQLCNEYGENGLNFVRQNFDRDVLADKYLSIINDKVVVRKS